jgi:hypothetical protein
MQPGAQFKLTNVTSADPSLPRRHEFRIGTYKNVDGNSGPWLPGQASGAAITVTAPQDLYRTLHYPTKMDPKPRFDDFQNRTDYEPEKETEPGEQMGLFNHYHEAPKVFSLAATPDARHHVGALLGMAALESHARYGETPQASSDLSPNSAPVVQRLIDKGLVKAPDQSDHNAIDHTVPEPGKVKAVNAMGNDYADMNIWALGQDTRRNGIKVGGYSKFHTQDHPYGAWGSQALRRALRPNRAREFDGGAQTALF